MTTLSLTNPVPGTTADANVIASNNNAILAVLNGGIDGTNISSSSTPTMAALTLTGGTATALALSGLAGGLTIHGDADLSRQAAGILKTTGTFNAVGGLQVNSVNVSADLGFNVKNATYGAVGNGSTDDTAAFNAAALAASAVSGFVLVPPGTYRIAGTITGYAGVRFVGVGIGATILLFDDVSGYGIVFEPAAFDVSTSLTADATAGSRSLTVTSTASFSVGDRVLVSDSKVLTGYGGAASGATFITRVFSITDGTHLVLEEAMPATVLSASSGQIQKLSTGFWSGVGVSGMTLKVAGTPARAVSRATLLRIRKCIAPIVSDVKFEGANASPLWLIESRDPLVTRCEWDHIYDPSGTSTTSASAIYVDLCTSTRIFANSMQRCASALNASRSPYTMFNNNTVGGAWIQAAFPLTSVTDTGGRGPKLIGRCDGSQVVGNTIHDFGYRAIYIADSLRCVVAVNTLSNVPDTAGASGDGIVVASLDASTTSLYCTVTGNTVWNVRDPGVWIVGDYCTVTGNMLFNTDQGATAAAIYLQGNANTVPGNLCQGYGAGRIGIYVSPGKSKNLIVANTCQNGASGWGIHTTDSAGGNKVGGNMTTGETLSIHASDLWKEVS